MDELTSANCLYPPFTCLCIEKKYFGKEERTYKEKSDQNNSKSENPIMINSYKIAKRHRFTKCYLRNTPKIARPPLLFLLIYLILIPLVSGYSPSPFSSTQSSFGRSASGIWKHTALLDEDGNYMVRWTPQQKQIMFQITVNTRGYIGFGLASNPKMDGADMVVGWVHSGKAYLQDRHGVGNEEPLVDSQQDWTLIAGYENDTHTSLIMSRPYNSCDKNDQAVTNDTIYLLWAYHSDDPPNPDNPHPRLHYHGWRRGTVPMFLLERARDSIPNNVLPFDYYRGITQSTSHTWFLRNPEVHISETSDTVYWCKLFKRPNLKQKHQIVKYEPVITEGNGKAIQHMIIYECMSLSSELDAVFEEMSMEPGEECYQSKMAHLIYTCNYVVAAWTKGSKGMTFPPEAGYPLTPDGSKFYMMETHYDNTKGQNYLDSSGLKVTYTSQLRLQDAGVLSLGMDPNWKHLIPPKQRTVVSEGHCISECTQSVLPYSGIHVFGTILHTHLLGRKIYLRHLRKNKEFEPIVEDNNYNVNYQEYRELQQPRHIRPGDHLITECVYNSRERSTITLGGFKTQDEMCLSFIFYWPKVDLSFCHSKPSLDTVLHSLGIQELSTETNPITIVKPEELHGKTLEWRLLNYNWNENFEYFQRVTSSGTFNPMCWRRGESLHPELENVDYSYPNITEVWKPDNVCRRRRLNSRLNNKNQKNLSLFGDDIMFDDQVADKPIERIDVDPYHHSGMFQPIYDEKAVAKENPEDLPSNGEVERRMDNLKDNLAITADPKLEEELWEMEKSLEIEVIGRQHPQHSPAQQNSIKSASAEFMISKLTMLVHLLTLTLYYIPND